jgi:hypothetical protein
MLPFMGKEELKKVAFMILDGEITNVRLEALFPFVGRETLDEITTKLIEQKDSERLRHVIPFIGKTKVLELYEAIENGTVEGIDQEDLLPFLGSEKIKELFYRSIGATKEDTPSEE